MKKRGIIFILILLGAFILSLSCASATFFINGTVYDPVGNKLANANVSVTVKNAMFAQVAVNTTMTNASGWFNLEVTNHTFYQLVIKHFNSSLNNESLDFVGQALPAFPHSEFINLANVNHYLKYGATINITVLNASNTIIGGSEFAYQIKDKKLGYPISMATTNLFSVTAYVPRDRNYSIMVYPAEGSAQHFVPVSFEFNNFSSTGSYTITDGNGASLSSYNATSKTLHKMFNVTEAQCRLTGNITMTGISGWDEFAITPYVLEPGDMVSMDYGDLQFNTSSWWGQTDSFELTSGYYNITLPYSPAETVNYLLFVNAVNTSKRYGAIRNITVNAANMGMNFTMYGMAGINQTINQSTSTGESRIINTTKQVFWLMNASNITFSNLNAHIEAIMDYTNYNATEFTWIIDLSGANDGNFTIPMLNTTGFKEINIYSANYPAKRIGTKTLTQVLANSSYTLSAFNPGDIDGALENSDIIVTLYKSNSSCDIPQPPAGCIMANSADLDTFNPFSVVVGGGALSFRIGSGGVFTHYVNVDLLASGPPDVSFDNNEAGTASGTTFSKALRFGASVGLKVYDYVLISIPFAETAGSGLNDSAEINMSLPYLYDEGWTTPIWDVANNGSKASDLAANYSHYSTKELEWGPLLNTTTCATTGYNSSYFNVTNPCYVDTSNNTIWIRLPHFSGIDPTITGSVVSSSSSSTSTSTSSSSGGSSAGSSTISNKVFKLFGILNKDEESSLSVSSSSIAISKISVTTNENVQLAKVTIERLTSKPSSLELPDGAVYQYLDISSKKLTEDKLKEVKIRFKVNKSWLEKNNYNVEDVKLARYKDGWKILPTTKETTNLETYTFEATTPGFSHFAILVEGATSDVLKGTTLDDSEETIEKVQDLESLSKKGSWFKDNWIIILLVLGGIIIIGGLGSLWWFKIRKNKNKEPSAPFKTKFKK